MWHVLPSTFLSVRYRMLRKFVSRRYLVFFFVFVITPRRIIVYVVFSFQSAKSESLYQRKKRSHYYYVQENLYYVKKSERTLVSFSVVFSIARDFRFSPVFSFGTPQLILQWSSCIYYILKKKCYVEREGQ